MVPRELLASATVPGGGELRLYRRGADFTILLGGNELMNSRTSGSEEALATMTCARLRGVVAPRLLIGGYGMGFTLRAALAASGPAARIAVAEIVPEVVAWARGPMAALTGGCLNDPRVTILDGDVADAIAVGRGAYDAILLDVDNGPDGLSRIENDRLYALSGLAAARAALAPNGILAIWSAGPAPGFARRLEKAGFTVDEVPLRARCNGKGARHVIWFGRRL